MNHSISSVTFAIMCQPGKIIWTLKEYIVIIFLIVICVTTNAILRKKLSLRFMDWTSMKALSGHVRFTSSKLFKIVSSLLIWNCSDSLLTVQNCNKSALQVKDWSYSSSQMEIIVSVIAPIIKAITHSTGVEMICVWYLSHHMILYFIFTFHCVE